MELHRLSRSLAMLIFILATYFSTVLARHHIRHSRHKRLESSSYTPAHFVTDAASEGRADYGPWTSWTEPSDCSRSCGGGVAFQTRQCRAEHGERCQGPSKRYFSCNIMECAAHAKDFRSEQCAEYNRQPFEERFYDWIPYTKAPNKCELNCMPRGERFYFRHKQKVVDGTRCDDEKLDVCVDGECRPVGCDMMLGSGAQEDRCRECGGDSSGCNTVTDVLSFDNLQSGYNDILLIPAGATNIIIQEQDAASNYLAIRNVSGHYYLNGNFRIDYPRDLKFAGTVFHYERKPYGFFSPESLSALGPTIEVIYIVLLYQEKGSGVKYEYSIPKGVSQQTDPDSYVWITSGFNDCTAPCGGGLQNRNVTCARRRDLNVVGDHLCDPAIKPAKNQPCNEEPCPAEWHVGDWEKCSAPCAGGTQFRKVYCQQTVSNARPTVIEDEICNERIGAKPVSTQVCNEDVICPVWHLGPWKPCDRLCGEGEQTRQVRCYRKIEGKIEVLKDDECFEEKPATQKSCSLRPCDGVDWMLTDWSGCTGKCGLTKETRRAVCATEKGKVHPDSSCEDFRLPELSRDCVDIETEGCNFQWYASQWSECSSECGKGIQTRDVFCASMDDSGLSKVEDNQCDPEKKYESEQECETEGECMGVWYSGPWGDCDKQCGGGNKMRKNLCFVNGTINPKECDGDKLPSTTEDCNNQACGEDDLLPMEPGHKIDEGDEDEDECVEEGDVSAEDLGVTPEEVFPSGGVTSGDLEMSSEDDDVTQATDDVTVTEATVTDVTGETQSSEEGVTEGTISAVTVGDSESSPSAASVATDSEHTTQNVAGTSSTEGGVSRLVSDDEVSTTPQSMTSTEAESSSEGATSSPESATTMPESSSTQAESSTEQASTQQPTTTTEEDLLRNEVESFKPNEDEGSGTVPEDSVTGTTSDGTSDASSEDSAVTSDGSTSDGATSDGASSFESTGSDFSAATSDSFEGSGFSTFGSPPDDWETANTADDFFSTLSDSPSVDDELFGSGFSTLSPLEQMFTKQRRKCKPRPKINCTTTPFGCCNDGIKAAKGPFRAGCPHPKTCNDTKHGCCPDGVSVAEGPMFKGCPPSLCDETLFGCCPDGVIASEGNDNEGCKAQEPDIIDCATSEHGCCPDGKQSATGENNEGCADDDVTMLPPECTNDLHGCCPGSEVSASGPNFEGCAEINNEDCKQSYFKCCPDGKTAALGNNNEGCESSCKDEKFGCCEDGRTPAHGPNKEGCCLKSQWGCCPDNILAAGGPNMQGCDCKYTTWSCCPDNRTPAKGPDNEGCGCKFSPHGCCPDKLAPAQGEGYEGCGCHTYQFGCCPDGIRIAKGPNKLGCDCKESEFGCCEDKITPASGANAEGCGCVHSEFGCCPDGETRAGGDKFEGCDDTPLIPGESCTLVKERGTCRDFTVKWFYDTEYGGCSRFWYGGCEGNTNRFASQDECKQSCVEPPGRDACYLPKIAGPCEGYYPTWYYDKDRRQCGQFVYGGCLGNNNKFQTREECETLCVVPDKADACEQPKLEGPCHGSYSRWYYDKDARACQMFTFGGCKGNNNNFLTEHACHQQCQVPGVRRALDVCALPKDRGPCPGSVMRWHYDASDDMCKQFVYGGCQGNPNRFRSKQNCEHRCHANHEMPEQDACAQPALVGECRNYTERWYFDALDRSCRPFYYGGCGANQNNFESERDCKHRCEEGAPAPPPVVTPIHTPSHTPEHCFLPMEAGPCSEYTSKWFYDSSDGFCKEFQYGGCDGNHNKYESREECEHKCGHVQDPCSMTKASRACDEAPRQFYYDQSSDTCQEASSDECLVNSNRFADLRQCEERCRRGREPVIPPGPVTVQEICRLPANPGICQENIESWYYDVHSSRCQAFVYTGCEGNSNRFESEEQCERQCGKFHGINVCKASYDAGSCRGQFYKWYFDGSSSQCQQFIYSGCEGNGNRFSSQQECESVCQRHMVSEPRNETHFDPASGSEEETTTVCTSAQNECRVLTELVRCEYGVERWMDSDTCERCRCADPCQGYTCPEGTRCAVDTHRDQFRPVCRLIEKPGECPAPGDGDSCDQVCQVDSDCTAQLKCCFNGCGTNCVEPLPSVHEDVTTRAPPHVDTTHQLEAPQITVPEHEISIEEGSFTTLRCLVRGSPIPAITWRKGNTLIDGSGGRHRLLLDGSLQIIGVYRSDAGGYTCTADNGVGRPAVREIRLDVTVPVSVNLTSARASYALGSSVQLVCSVDGYPIPRVQWFKDDTLLEATERIQITEGHRLQISRAENQDSGTYRCEAYNQFTSAISAIDITIDAQSIHPNCTDKPLFANCKLIVQARYCTHQYYARFCCKSCTEAGQLPQFGPHLEGGSSRRRS